MTNPEAFLGLQLAGRWPLERWLGAGPRSWCFASGNSAVKVRSPLHQQGLQPFLELKRRSGPGLLSYQEVGLVHSGPLAGCTYTVEPLGEPLSEPDLEVGKGLLKLLAQLEERGISHGRVRASNVIRWRNRWLLSDTGCAPLDDQYRPTGAPPPEPQSDVAALFAWLTLPEPPPDMGPAQALAELEQALRESEEEPGPTELIAPEIVLDTRGPVQASPQTLWVGADAFRLYDGARLQGGSTQTDYWSLSALSGNGKRLALYRDNDLRVLRTDTMELLARFEPGESLHALWLDENGECLRVLAEQRVTQYAVSDRVAVGTWALGNHRTSFGFFYPEYMLALTWHKLRIYRISSQGPTAICCFTGGDEKMGPSITTALFEPATGRVVSGWTDGSLKVGSLQTAEPAAAELRARALAEIQRLQNGAASPESPTRIWELESEYIHDLPPVPMRAVAHHGVSLCSLALSPDGQHLFSLSMDGCMRVWQWPSLQCLGELPNSYANEVSCPPDPEVVILQDGMHTTLLQRQALLQRLQRVLLRFNVRQQTMDVTGVLQAVRCGERLVCLTADAVWIGSERLEAATSLCRFGEGFAVARGGAVICHGPDGNPGLSLPHPSPVQDIASLGSCLVSLDSAYTIRCWNEEGTCRWEKASPRPAQRFHCGTGSEVVLESPDLIFRVSPEHAGSGFQASYTTVAASPMERLVAWSENTSINFWYPEHSRYRQDLHCQQRVVALAFSPDALCLAAALERELVLFHAENGRELARLPLAAHGLQFNSPRELLAWTEDGVHDLILEPVYG